MKKALLWRGFLGTFLTLLFIEKAWVQTETVESVTKPGSVNSRITDQIKAFVLTEAPILVQYGFEESKDALVDFIHPQHVKPTVYWEHTEIGGAHALYFLWFRSYSKSGWTAKDTDAESSVQFYKKTTETMGYHPTVDIQYSDMVAASNAHGAPLFGACSRASLKCLPPDFSKNLEGFRKIDAVLKNQIRGIEGERLLERLDLDQGPVIYVSEPKTHAIAPVTNIGNLLIDIEKKDGSLLKTVVYYHAPSLTPAMLERLRNLFHGATFRDYHLSARELSSTFRTKMRAIEPRVMRKNQNKTVAQTYLFPAPGTAFSQMKATLDFWNRKIQMRDVPPVFQDAEGKDSGSNGFWAWPHINQDTQQQQHLQKKEVLSWLADNENDPSQATYVTALHAYFTRVMPEFFTSEEREQGALKTIRNGWMVSVDQK